MKAGSKIQRPAFLRSIGWFNREALQMPLPLPFHRAMPNSS